MGQRGNAEKEDQDTGLDRTVFAAKCPGGGGRKGVGLAHATPADDRSCLAQ